MTETTQPDLLVTHQDGVMWLTFNRPQKANALSLPLLVEFNQALRDAAKRDDVRAVVVTGAGERNFSAGADLSRPAENAAAYLAQRRAEFAAALIALVDFTKPVVAAVNGAACGAGMMIPLLCDATVAADTARFSLPEINKGLPALPGVAIVKDRFGSALAADIVLSGRWMPAQEALARGVVREVVPHAGLNAAAQKIALALGAFDKHAYAADKALVNRTLKADLAAAIKTSAEFHGHAGKH
jgi:enoyl-CoA hydratase